MKNLKRILSAFLVLAMIISCFMAVPTFAEEAETTEAVTETGTGFSDINKTDKYANAVIVLNKLSIINGYPDGTFLPLNNVTRAEFAALLLRMIGMDQEVAPIADPFPDVSKDFWAAGSIEVAKNMKIITGYEDGTFRAANNVSYEEALTMIIRAIGYENYSAPGSEWYSRYVTSANRLGITKNAVGSVGTPATRSCIAQFIYDTLEVYSRENDEIQETTIMEAYLGLKKAEGVIAYNGVTGLDSPDVNLRDNEVVIMDRKTEDTETFRVDNIGEYSDKLGSLVTYYYKEDLSSGYKDIIMFEVKQATKTETIQADQIETDDCDNLTIVYYKSDDATKASKFSLDENNIVIYNDKLYGDDAAESRFDADDMIPEIGSIKVLNIDGDSDYDIIFVDSYEVYAVSSVTASNSKVIDNITRTAPNNSITLDEDDDTQIIKFVDKDGKTKKFSDIKKNHTICVKESNDNSGTKMITVVLCGAGVTGEVQSVSAEKVKVNSKSYNFSPVAPWIAGDETAPAKGETYMFFLDINGDIVGMSKENVAEETGNYGFIIGYGKKKGSGLDDESPLYLNILTQSGSKTQIALHRTTKINGDSISGDFDYALELLEDSADYQGEGASEDMGARQLIKYTTKSSGGTTVFDKIATVTSGTADDTDGGEVDIDELRMYSGFTSDDDDVKYTSSSKLFQSGSNKVYLGSATVFVVPENVTVADDYRKGSSSDFKNDNYYKIEIFDMSKSKSAKVIVLYGGNSTTEVDTHTALFRVEEHSEEVNDDNGTMIKITGYESGGDKEVSYWVSPDSEDLVDTLSEGDIVRFGTDSDGYVTLAEEDILYQTYVTDEPFYKAEDEDRNETNAKKYASSDLKLILGSIYSVADGTVIVVPEFLAADDEAESDITDEAEVLRLATSKFSSSVKYYEYDMSSSTIKISAIPDFTVDAFSAYDDGSDATKVLIYMKDGVIKSVTTIVE